MLEWRLEGPYTLAERTPRWRRQSQTNKLDRRAKRKPASGSALSSSGAICFGKVVDLSKRKATPCRTPGASTEMVIEAARRKLVKRGAKRNQSIAVIAGSWPEGSNESIRDTGAFTCLVTDSKRSLHRQDFTAGKDSPHSRRVVQRYEPLPVDCREHVAEPSTHHGLGPGPIAGVATAVGIGRVTKKKERRRPVIAPHAIGPIQFFDQSPIQSHAEHSDGLQARGPGIPGTQGGSSKTPHVHPAEAGPISEIPTEPPAECP